MSVAQKNKLALEVKLAKVCRKIAPLWSLQNFVAVNPYLGLAEKSFKDAAYEMAIASDIKMTLAPSFYLEKIAKGEINTSDVEKSLKNSQEFKNISAKDFLNKVANQKAESLKINSLTETANLVFNEDWDRLLVARVSMWAAAYFDEEQAKWKSVAANDGLFLSWKNEAATDKSTEILGLKNFRKYAKEFPENPLEAIAYSITILGLNEDIQELYFYRLLLKMNGWASYAARIDWENELHGINTNELPSFLAVLISWEACFMQAAKSNLLQEKWLENKQQILKKSTEKVPSTYLQQQLILQQAFDIASQNNIVDLLNTNQTQKVSDTEQVLAQAVFCIDVRSEVFRRNLEQEHEQIQSFGFAGFFGFPIAFIPAGHKKANSQCPVLIKPVATINERIIQKDALTKRATATYLKNTWKSFKSGAVSCFSFVSPVGLAFLPKLFSDSFGLTRAVAHPDFVGIENRSATDRRVELNTENNGKELSGMPLQQQIDLAFGALKGMSLTENFGKFILLVGHGSSSVNNPYASGLDCGACAGHSGEANAKVAAAVFNNKEVREALRLKGIAIPAESIFLACLHNTTTDKISIFNENEVPKTRIKDLEELKLALARAGKNTRAERAKRMGNMGKNIDKSIFMRSKDWSQTRPEWGLAGCSSFIIAPREKTAGISLQGKAFLHSYNWKRDTDFSILEGIMTAPMIVTSWISLQYFASTVDNAKMGSGNKTLHNVAAGHGVLEGYSGDLRVGLPFQSIHDGEKYQHEPIKLNVVINAPTDAMNQVLQKHQNVKNLCDNEWIHLLAMNDEGKVTKRYTKNLSWEAI